MAICKRRHRTARVVAKLQAPSTSWRGVRPANLGRACQINAARGRLWDVNRVGHGCVPVDMARLDASTVANARSQSWAARMQTRRRSTPRAVATSVTVSAIRSQATRQLHPDIGTKITACATTRAQKSPALAGLSRSSGGGIRTRDLRVMRSPKGGRVGPDRPCLLGLAQVRWGLICSKRNLEWNHGRGLGTPTRGESCNHPSDGTSPAQGS
jgi:hypothetical protein